MILDRLRALADPLYAVLDAARDDRVLAWLAATGAEHASLYEGWQGDALADVAPYLVRLAPDAPLLALLVERGWGQSLGVWLTSRARPKDVRARLRRLLMVQVGGAARAMYFRFYDPRVLRFLLPMATPRQATWFFGDGEIDAYIVEDAGGRGALRFTAGPLSAAEGAAVRTQRIARHDGASPEESGHARAG